MGPGPPAGTSPLALDKVIHGPLRLGIVAALASADHRTFTELRAALGATDGNLNASLQRLERAGYVSATRNLEGRVARSEYRLTRAGQKALAQYLQQIEAIIGPIRGRTTGG